jgi:hypothetical protein
MDSHQRRRMRRHSGKAEGDSMAEAKHNSVKESPRSLRPKLLLFFEHPWVMGPISIIGGIVGVLFYTPVLIFCGIGIMLAFHRVEVVKKRKWPIQVAAYVGLFVITFLVLYGAGSVIRKSLHNQTDGDKPKSLSDYSNGEIKDSAKDLTHRLRALQRQFDAEDSQFYSQLRVDPAFITKSDELHSKHLGEFGPLRAEANNLVPHLLNRVPPPQPRASALVEAELGGASLVGVEPVDQVADYIDQLSGLVPVSRR